MIHSDTLLPKHPKTWEDTYMYIYICIYLVYIYIHIYIYYRGFALVLYLTSLCLGLMKNMKKYVSRRVKNASSRNGGARFMSTLSLEAMVSQSHFGLGWPFTFTWTDEICRNLRWEMAPKMHVEIRRMRSYSKLYCFTTEYTLYI